MTVQVLNQATGDVVTMSIDEYEALIDARDHALAMRDIAAGSMPMIADEDMDAYLAAPTPLAFWRRKRGLTQAHLAEMVEVSQPHIAQLEVGRRQGASVALYARLARVLGVRIDDLIEDGSVVVEGAAPSDSELRRIPR